MGYSITPHISLMLDASTMNIMYIVYSFILYFTATYAGQNYGRLQDVKWLSASAEHSNSKATSETAFHALHEYYPGSWKGCGTLMTMLRGVFTGGRGGMPPPPEVPHLILIALSTLICPKSLKVVSVLIPVSDSFVLWLLIYMLLWLPMS